MPDSEFNKHKDALIKNILEREIRLRQRSNRYWSEIDAKHYQFDSHQKLANAVKQISKEGFVQFYKNRLLGNRSNRLVVKSDGNGKKAVTTEAADQIKTILDKPRQFSSGKPFFDLEAAY